MVVVSQDHELVNWDRITCIKKDDGKTINGKYQVVALNDKEKIILGTYDTEALADRTVDHLSLLLDPQHPAVNLKK